MAAIEVATRLAVLEREVARLRSKVEGTETADVPWWERVVGTFADDQAHKTAMKLGRDYRASLRPRKPRTRKG